MSDPPHGDGDLRELEEEQAKERSGLRPQVVHEVIRREGELELERPLGALAWSGLAAGLSMGLSLLAEGLLKGALPASGWAVLATRLGYTVGFVATILSRQQLFTENTLIAVIPLLSRRDLRTLGRVARLWAIVLVANLVGCLVFAVALAKLHVVDGSAAEALRAVSHEATHLSGVDVFVRAIFAGWLIALMMWMLPAAEHARVVVVLIMTYVIGLAGFPHIIASSVDAFYAAFNGALGGAHVAAFLSLTLAGNIVGGVSLVAAVNHAQVVTGSKS